MRNFLLCQYPMAYIAKNDASGETFKCYHDFGCFASEQEAYDDAQIEADRIIRIVVLSLFLGKNI